MSWSAYSGCKLQVGLLCLAIRIFSINFSDPLFVETLRSQLSISLARGTTDAILTNLNSILRTPDNVLLNLSSIADFLQNSIHERTLEQSIITVGNNE